MTSAVLLATFSALLSAAEMQVKWSQAPKTLIENRKVEVRLAGGERLVGKAIAVTPEGLRMNTGHGERMVGKSDIVALKVRKPHVRGRIICTVAAGAAAGAYSGMSAWTTSSGDIGAKLTAVSIAAVAGGYVLGWMWDRSDVTTIRIKKE